jgi:hypothetical protein
MPDHVHFFCRAQLDAKALPVFMQRWKGMDQQGEIESLML